MNMQCASYNPGQENLLRQISKNMLAFRPDEGAYFFCLEEMGVGHKS